MFMEYDKMLDRLYMLLPAKSKSDVRFEVPKPESYIQGSKTFVRNFGQIIKQIHREEKHMLKYLTKETGTSASANAGRLIVNSRIPAMQVNKIFDSYVKRFVLCPVCSKPDTIFTDQHGIKMMKCEACGALSPLAKV